MDKSTQAGVEQYLNIINSAFPQATVQGFQPIINTLALPDMDDRHVAAAAIKARANTIVTFNNKHFPQEVLSSYGIHVYTPDDFLCLLFTDDPQTVFAAMTELVDSKKRPPRSFNNEILGLTQRGAPSFATQLQKYLSSPRKSS